MYCTFRTIFMLRRQSVSIYPTPHTQAHMHTHPPTQNTSRSIVHNTLVVHIFEFVSPITLHIPWMGDTLRVTHYQRAFLHTCTRINNTSTQTRSEKWMHQPDTRLHNYVPEIIYHKLTRSRLALTSNVHAHSTVGMTTTWWYSVWHVYMTANMCPQQIICISLTFQRWLLPDCQ